MATISNGESGSSVRTKLNEIINKVEGVTSINNNIDVTGTVTADGLSVDGNIVLDGILQLKDSGGTARSVLDYSASDDVTIATGTSSGARSIYMITEGQNALRVHAGGDISFYEDTGTTAKFFWDAAAESLGIGTSSPATILDIKGSTGNSVITLNSALAIDTYPSIGKLRFYSNDNSTNSSGEVGSLEVIGISSWNGAGNNAAMTFNLIQGLAGTTSPVEAMRITSDGSLQIAGTGAGNSSHSINFTNGACAIARDANNLELHGYDNIVFGVSNTSYPTSTERMRIDSSGRVGIGGVPNTNWRNDISNQEILMLGTEATLFSDNVTTELWNNAYVDNSNAFKNISTRGASRYFQYEGAHKWFTAASATAGSTISTELNTTPKMILDVSGNLLVGKTDTDFDVAGIFMGNDVIHGIRDDAHPLALNRQTSDGDLIQFYKDGGDPVGSIGAISDGIYIGNGEEGIRFDQSLNAIIPCTSTGSGFDNHVTLGADNPRFKDLYLSGGVYLGGTTSDNLLDDYEEGTWTPVLYATGTDFTSVSYDGRTGGTYTKIGRVVHIQMTIVSDAITVGSASGDIAISGLPFAASSGTGGGTDQGYAALSLAYASNWSSNPPQAARVIEGSSAIGLYTGIATTATVVVADAGTGANDNYVNITGTYITDA